MLLKRQKLHQSRSWLHWRTSSGTLALVLLCLWSPFGGPVRAQQTQACDASQFQGNISSIGPSYPASSCSTCVFPSWQAVSIDTTKLLQLDLTGKWLYMLGDSTTAQLHGELLAYLDEPQVRPPSFAISHLAKHLPSFVNSPVFVAAEIVVSTSLHPLHCFEHSNGSLAIHVAGQADGPPACRLSRTRGMTPPVKLP